MKLFQVCRMCVCGLSCCRFYWVLAWAELNCLALFFFVPPVVALTPRRPCVCLSLCVCVCLCVFVCVCVCVCSALTSCDDEESFVCLLIGTVTLLFAYIFGLGCLVYSCSMLSFSLVPLLPFPRSRFSCFIRRAHTRIRAAFHCLTSPTHTYTHAYTHSHARAQTKLNL